MRESSPMQSRKVFPRDPKKEFIFVSIESTRLRFDLSLRSRRCTEDGRSRNQRQGFLLGTGEEETAVKLGNFKYAADTLSHVKKRQLAAVTLHALENLDEGRKTR